MFFELFEVLSLIVEVIKVIEKICVALGIIDSKQDPEDLGDKAIQAEEKGMRPDDFESFDEYKQKLDSFELDPIKTAETSKEAKLTAALEVMIIGLEDKLGALGTERTILTKIGEDQEFFNPDRVQNYIKTFSEAGIDLDNVSKYFNRDLSLTERDMVGPVIEAAEKSIDATRSKEQISEDIRDHIV